MALVALDGTPLVMVGATSRVGLPYLSSAAGTATLLDAANEACIFVGQIFTEDGESHTIDTTGSSSIGWRSGALTFANAGTVVKVGLAAVDMATGPPARAANAANVITLDVSKSLTGGGGGITANLWQEHVPDAGTKTIANGDFVAFAVQIISVAGGDAVNVQCQPTSTAAIPVLPVVTQYLAAAYGAATLLPNFSLTFADGALGSFYGGFVYLTGMTTITWNNTSGTKEYGNFLQMPVPAKIYGLVVHCGVGGNADFILYTDPLGTPVAEKTVSVDANAVGSSGIGTGRWLPLLFASPYSSTANQPLAAIAKPTSASSIVMNHKTVNIAAHQKFETLGTNGYAINRNTGAFAAQNSNKDRFGIGLLVGAFEAGGGAGIGALVGGSLVR